ncbi:MAG: hypothetical protein WCI61_04760 [Chloroflexota bacterium]
MPTRSLLRDALGWGFALWLFGYLAGVLLFFVVPAAYIGIVLTPVAALLTVWVLLRRVQAGEAARDIVIAVVWTAIAAGLDYVFIVELLRPADGYYKPDVALYYGLTFVLPVVVGRWRRSRGVEAG